MLSRQPATIDYQYRASDKGRGIACQVEHGLGDILRTTDASQRAVCSPGQKRFFCHAQLLRFIP